MSVPTKEQRARRNVEAMLKKARDLAGAGHYDDARTFEQQAEVVANHGGLTIPLPAMMIFEDPITRTKEDGLAQLISKQYEVSHVDGQEVWTVEYLDDKDKPRDRWPRALRMQDRLGATLTAFLTAN